MNSIKKIARDTTINTLWTTFGLVVIIGIISVIAIGVHEGYVSRKAAKREALDERIAEIAKAYAGEVASDLADMYTRTESIVRQINAVSADAHINITTHRHEGDGVKLGNDAPEIYKDFPFKGIADDDLFYRKAD